MIDRFMLKLLHPVVDSVVVRIARRGITADMVTLWGFGIGMLAALLIVWDHSSLAIIPLLLNRAFDGLDGALARQSKTTDRGAFLDIGLDFIFYGSIPLAFAICNPAENALPAALLLAAFLGTGTSFLAFAIIAEKRGLKSTAYPSKAFYYLGGLTEGTETILCFLAFCIWPGEFPLIAMVYAAMCAVTTATRLVAGWQIFGADARS